jgi:anti-anti-sigma regulatory factor
MSISINYEAGVYEINGTLNTQNGACLQDQLENLFKHTKGMVVSLNKTIDLDANSANILVALQEKAFRSKKSFFIIGLQNQKVNVIFQSLGLNDILL